MLPRPLKGTPEFGISWAYPNTYSVGMAGLGYQLVWWLLEQNPSIEVRRVFTDVQQEGWRDSELFGFTLSWELDYLNVLQMLDKSGIPRLSNRRDDMAPVVFGGGPVLTANPEPFADFFDVILLGDAEESVPALLHKWSEVRSLPTRQEKLAALAAVDGLYVPSLYQFEYEPAGPVRSITPKSDSVPSSVRRRAFMAPADYIAHTVILSPQSSWADMFLVEVVRSCPQECRFCLASFLTRPFRAANVDGLLQKIELGLQHTRKIGLLGPSVTEHPQFPELAASLMKKENIELSVASIRADTIDPLILEMLVKLGQRSVTIALESGSERLRAIMKKNLTESEILTAMEMIASSGLSGVKLYGIVGLPGETSSDLEETVGLLTTLKKKHKQMRITFGVSSFVPKAQTPFQWAGRDKDSAKKIEYVRKHLSKVGIDVRPESHNWSDIQALLSRGDRRLTPVLLAAADASGNLGSWKKALRNLPPGCPDQDYFIHRYIPYEEVLPRSHLVDDAKALMLKKHSLSANQLADELPVIP